MSPPGRISRRTAIGYLGAAIGAARPIAILGGAGGPITIDGQPVEVEVRSISAVTVRITARPVVVRRTEEIAITGELRDPAIGRRRASGRAGGALRRVSAGDLVVRWIDDPPAIVVEGRGGTPVQRFGFPPGDRAIRFELGSGPVLGLGEGGPQFDRRGAVDPMINGSDGYRLSTHGVRAPIQWLIGTSGWAMFVHEPHGAFDLSGSTGALVPAGPRLPFDAFVVGSNDPARVMREYATITGFAELPPLWTFGYQQSHRTLAGPDEVRAVAQTFRDKRLPCDALIYLGTDFCPSGWNTHNGEFTWNAANFPDPPAMIRELHDRHFKVVLHSVIEGHRLIGTVHDRCAAPEPSGRTPDGKWPDERHVACLWLYHEPAMRLGVDGWWPDQGDDYDVPSELNRHRMYREGSQLVRPGERPYALHRNAAAGIQRYGGFIWSGDVQSRWETLRTHVAVAINTGLSGLPYWGTDIGGFIPTAEYTGELHVRWFQFGAFCPLMRAHGRNWHLRLPWGWDDGDGGPSESGRFKVDPAELHNAAVGPICRRYLELRYRLLPYLYTAARECHDTGMPIMRALWLHHADDSTAMARGDEYLWGRDILVAPVVEKGAESRKVYLPRGTWYDVWDESPVTGGREITRDVDLATMPLYVRAGAVIPMAPVRQYVDEPTDEPVTLVVYPGADGESAWYEDDGHTFAYRRGEAMRVVLGWEDRSRRLTLRLARGSRMLRPGSRALRVRVAGSTASRTIEFDGRATVVAL